MKSGLEGRNNRPPDDGDNSGSIVSMKSGLEGRNNLDQQRCEFTVLRVSMKSGLEGRNNWEGREKSTVAGVLSQ